MPYSGRMETSKLLTCIGNRIRVLRKEKGLSQERLSEISGLHPTSLSNIERGKVDSAVSNYISLAQALGVTLAELVDTSTDLGDGESWREARMLMERVKTLDDKRRAVYLDAAAKLFEKIESI